MGMLKVGGRGDVKGKVLSSPCRHVSSSPCIIVAVYRCHCVSSSSCPHVSSSPPVLATSSSCVLIVILCPCHVVVPGCHRPVSQQGELGQMWDGGYSPWCPRLTTTTNNDIAQCCCLSFGCHVTNRDVAPVFHMNEMTPECKK